MSDDLKQSLTEVVTCSDDEVAVIHANDAINEIVELEATIDSLRRENEELHTELERVNNRWADDREKYISSPWIAVETGKGPKERGEYLVMCGDKTKFIFVTRGGGDVLKEKREEQTTIDGVFHPITHYTPIPEIPVTHDGEGPTAIYGGPDFQG